MKIDLNTYNEIIKWSYSKEGILVILVVMYFAWFLIPAVQVAFLNYGNVETDGEKTEFIIKILVFLITFLIIPPLIILVNTLDFIGLLPKGSE